MLLQPLEVRTDVMLVNTTEELEFARLALLRHGKVPVFPITPLVRTVSSSASDADSDRVLLSLDTQSPSSVLYVSLRVIEHDPAQPDDGAHRGAGTHGTPVCVVLTPADGSPHPRPIVAAKRVRATGM